MEEKRRKEEDNCMMTAKLYLFTIIRFFPLDNIYKKYLLFFYINGEMRGERSCLVKQ